MAKFLLGFNVGLFEELASRYPSQVVEPFKEPVLVIDAKHFRAEWEQALKAEGCKVLVSDFLGKSCFLVRKPKNGEAQSQNTQQKPQAVQPVQIEPTKAELKPFEWTKENLELVKHMRLQGLSFREIERKLRELGFKIHHVTLSKKLKALELKAEPSKPNCISENYSLFREYLDGATILFERNLRKACAILLKEAAKILENA